MVLLKKNPVFCLVAALLLLVFVAGCALALAESGKLDTLKRKLVRAERQLAQLRDTAPSPSVENVAVAEQNAEQLSAQLQRILEDLQGGAGLTLSDDGVRVMSAIQQYITDHQKLAQAHVGVNEVPTAVAIADDFAFGFERYLDEAIIPEDPAVVPVLDKQRQVLSYIVKQLIAAHPVGIQKVERELLELKAVSGKPAAGFQIKPAVSARVAGAIDTLAFSVSFSGYTRSLRLFLNNLAQFDLPIVVRSVEVARPSESAAADTAKPSKGQEMGDIFSAFGAPAALEATPSPSQTPVIAENVSHFTVTLEFIEIILPDAVPETSELSPNE